MSTTLRQILKNKRPLIALVNSRLSSSEHPNIIKSAAPEVVIPDATLVEFVFRNLDQWSNKIALECGQTGRKYTHEEVRRKSKNFSKALRKKLKLKKGDVIAVLLPNVPEYSVTLLGALDAGLIVTTINPIYVSDEVSRHLMDSNTKAIVTLNQLWPVASEAVNNGPNRIPIITIKTQESDSTPQGAISFSEFTDNICDIEDVKPGKSTDIAVMPYSSGTTGLPKGVELTHKNIIANLQQIGCPYFKVVDEAVGDHQDVVPGILPMYHIYGLTSLLINTINTGSKLVTLPKFAPDLFISTLMNNKFTVLPIVPPIVLFITNHTAVKKEYLQSVRTMVSGAAPLGALDENRFLKKAEKPIEIVQGYGLTETSPTVTQVAARRKKEIEFYGSVGEVVSNTYVKIVPADNSKGDPLGPNQPGEIMIKGPQVMKTYHNKPKETSDSFIDGWLRTGDMAYYDDNKMLYITDRLKELIKVKGFQVPPAELEEILRSHPHVMDAAVIGVPHSQQGEVPKAYIVPQKDVKIDMKQLQDYVSSKVAPYKQLKGGIELIEAIPKNASGKIMRRELKVKFAASN